MKEMPVGRREDGGRRTYLTENYIKLQFTNDADIFTYSVCFCICLSLSVSLCVCLCLCVCLFHPQDPRLKNGRYGGPQAFWVNTLPLSYTLNDILKKKRGDNLCLDQRKLFKEEVGFGLKF